MVYLLFLITRVFLVTLHYKKALHQLRIVTVVVRQVHTDLLAIQRANAFHVLKVHIVIYLPTNVRNVHPGNMRALNRHLAHSANLESFKKNRKNRIVIHVMLIRIRIYTEERNALHVHLKRVQMEPPAVLHV